MARRNWASEQLGSPESGSLNFSSGIDLAMQGTGAKCSNSCFDTGFGLHSGGPSAISSMLLNLCMYIPVSINLMALKHCRCAVAVIFSFLIKWSICYYST